MPEYDPTIRHAPIPEFPGYQAASDGSIWSCHHRNGAGTSSHWHPLKPKANRSGHLVVSLRKTGRTFTRHVHTLVLEAFIGPRPEGMECRHFPDRNPSNNRLENLQWGSHEENRADMLIHGSRVRGSQHVGSKLDESQVLAIRASYPRQTFKALARTYHVDWTLIREIVHRRSWAHVQP